MREPAAAIVLGGTGGATLGERGRVGRRNGEGHLKSRAAAAKVASKSLRVGLDHWIVNGAEFQRFQE
jgi:hypothetical protein